MPLVDDVFLSHEQEAYPTTSLNETCIEFEFQTDRNCYVHLRQTHFDLKLKIDKGRCYETYNIKGFKKEHKADKKADEQTAEEDQEAPVPLVAHVNNILHSIVSNLDVYINNQQTYK